MTKIQLLNESNQIATPRRVGILAGWGDFPVVVARTLKQSGHQVYCLGVKDHADPKLAEICDHFAWQGLAKLGAAIRYYRRHGVQQATMAGKIHKVRLYQPWLWLKHIPDWQMIKTFYPHFIAHTEDRRDDTLLGTLVQAFGKEGISFEPATDLIPELLVKEGLVAGRPLTAPQQKDVDFGWQMAKQMGQFDIGQCVCIKDQSVLAVEAVEGTDQCIARAGELCASGGFTVVKVAKPQQDMRFDVPTIGLGTLQTMISAGARVLAIEADKTILLDESAVRALAEKHKIAIVAIRNQQQRELAA